MKCMLDLAKENLCEEWVCIYKDTCTTKVKEEGSDEYTCKYCSNYDTCSSCNLYVEE